MAPEARNQQIAAFSSLTIGVRETPEGGPSEILRSVATLAAAAGHEINNPLMAIVGSLEILEKTQPLDAYGRARLAAALVAAGQIAEAIRRLGRITRLELAVGDPICRPCSISRGRVRGRRASARSTDSDDVHPSLTYFRRSFTASSMFLPAFSSGPLPISLS